MSRCVPCWDLDENSAPIGVAFPSAHSNSTTPDVPMLDFEVAELTWENGQLALHGLGPPRPPAKTLTSINPSKYTWEKPRASGTLESIVDQATCLPKAKASCDGEQLVTWIDHHRGLAAAATTVTLAMDAMVPCSNRSEDPSTHVIESVPMIGGTCMVGCSTRVGSCSGPVATQEEDILMMGKQARAPARDSVAPAWSGRDQSVSCSATFVRDSQHVSLDAYERDVVAGITSTSMASPENTSSAKPCTKTTTADDHDSVCHSRPQREAGDEEDQKKGTAKSSVSTKRSRAAAIHNQSERKRRDKINQRMKTLQKLVPNSSKTDKASMLDEVIDYLKQLQAQVQMMRNMSMPHMMLPMTMQQQLQMSMMAPAIGMGMGMPGMGMGMGVMDINSMNRAPNMTSISPVIPNPFVPITSWDGAADRPQAAPATMVADPLSAFLAYQSQPMTMDAYSRMAAMYQQLQQPPTSSSKN